jgi:phosphoenolpyruvate---glycerone phosphotransferase subunit DhaL
MQMKCRATTRVALPDMSTPATNLYWEDHALMTNEDVLHWLERTADVLRENRTYLTELDSAIGDADHGINMDRGFSAVRDKFPTMATMDIPTRLKTVGSTLVSTVGGASGPLYGTAYLRAAGAVAVKEELTTADIVAMLEAFLGGIVARGKAQPGEKTMVDALTPALNAAKQALNDGATLEQLTDRAATAAEEGVKATIPLLATKGRASYLGERSIGHQDPGATSSSLILRCLAEICKGK